ncbi:efflux RND transporter permease subunit [Luteimonas sp. XNQY3]|nr:efflux RND transporter permease subunit [Luteimonas sp. XNQY3]MCD9004758.1 efflux RND transporter permease subunit [Luteimonas sp. XNQY3]
MNFGRILEQGNLIAVATVIVCVLGLAAALRVPVQMIPDVDTRTVMVETRWPGATPQDVEQEILVEQEQYLRTLPGLRRIVSVASSGLASIQLEFPFGTDINEALLRTSNALNQVSGYPENVDPPALTTESASQEPFMYFAIGPRAGSGLDLDLAMIRDFLEDQVRPRLERLPGVSQVEVNGGAERQVRIELDPQRLAQRGLDMVDVRSALRADNIDTSGGDLDRGRQRILVRTMGRFTDVESIGALVIAERSGVITRLADVGEVRLSHHERREIAFHDGEPALILALRREAGANVIQTKYTVLPEIDAIREQVLAPEGLDITLFSEDARYVEASVASVWRALVLGALLASLVIHAFVRSLRTTAIAVVAIPICTLAAFAGLLLTGRTLNVISLAGVAFALGMSVDNAVVVLESIDQARRRGLARFAAAVEGVCSVWPAVLACTMTTVIVFLPIFFIEEEAGQLFSDIAIAIVAAIVASLIVAITVVPALTAHQGGSGAVQPAVGDGHFERLTQALVWWVLTPRRRVAVIAATVLVSVVGVVVLTPPAEYLPEGEETRIFAEMVAPPGYSLTEMHRIADDLIRDLRPHVGEATAARGEDAARFPRMAMFAMFVAPEAITFVTDPARASDLDALRRALESRFEAVPGMRASTARGSIISSDDGGTRSINLEISGNDLAEVYRVAALAYARADTLFDDAQISSQPGSLSLDQPLIELLPRRERIAEVGLDAGRFGYAVAALSDGAYASEMILDGRRVDIYLFSNVAGEQRLARLADQPIATPSGAILPVSALADFRESTDTDSIRRVDGRRTVTIGIVPPRSVALESGVALVRAQLMEAMAAAGEIPDGITLDISGASDQLDATRASLAGNFAFSLLLCYLVLVAIFGRWGRPLIVMATIPLGAAGGIFGLAMLNGAGAVLALLGLGGVEQPFDMITLLGFLVLLSAVVNNPILIVMETYRALGDGAAAIDAVRGAIRTRIRPILISSLSTVIGLLPLIVIPGAGTELYRGLGTVMLSGVLMSTLVTVTFLPCFLVTVIGLSRRSGAGSVGMAAVHGWLRGRRAAGTAGDAE